MIGSVDAGVTVPPIGISKSFNCESTNASARHTPPVAILKIFSRFDLSDCFDIKTPPSDGHRSDCSNFMVNATDKRIYEKIYKVPYAGIIRQVQRVGCLIPLSFLKLPDFRFVAKNILYGYVKNKASALVSFTESFGRMPYEKQYKHQYRRGAEAYRVNRHDALESVILLEYGIDP